jgi:hypothetical protein
MTKTSPSKNRMKNGYQQHFQLTLDMRRTALGSMGTTSDMCGPGGKSQVLSWWAKRFAPKIQ